MRKHFMHCLMGLGLLFASTGSLMADDIVDLEKDSEGFYKLYTLDDWIKFADAVNAGNTRLNGRMYADIGTVVGNNEGENHTITQYCGHFDGQGYKLDVDIRYINQDLGAPFNSLGTPDNSSDNRGALVENLWTTGVIYTNMKNIGGIAGAMYWSSIKNCISTIRTLAEKREGDLDKVGGSPWSGGTWDGTEGGLVGKAFTAGCEFINCEWAGSQYAPLAHSTCGICAYSGDGPQTLDGCISITEWTLCSSNGTTGRNVALMREKSNEGNTLNVYTNNWCTLAETYDMGQRIFVQGKCNNVTTIDKVYSGALCYAINGDQRNIRYYQNIEGEDLDSVPVPFSNGGKHKQVYVKNELRCDGTPIGDPVYTNTPSASGVPDHQYVDGVCEVCGTYQSDFMTADEDGWFTVNNDAEMKWVWHYLQNTTDTYNVRLNADVNLGENTMVSMYKGTFDGQGHTLTYKITANVDFAGMFGTFYGTLKNIELRGSIYNGQRYAGAVGGGCYGHVENLISRVAVSTGYSGDATTGTIGGISYDGFSLKNVIAAGTVSSSTANCCGGLIGWASGSTKMENTFWVGTCETLSEGCSTFIRNSGSCTFTNCYYLNTSGNNDEGSRTTKLTSSATTNGFIAYILNGSSFINPTFYQTVGQDDLPTLDSTHGVVYQKADETYASVQDEESYADFVNALAASEKARLAKTGTSTTMINEYLTTLNDILASTSTMQEFYARYPELQQQQTDMATCAGLYTTFQQLVEKYKAELEATGTEGELRALLYDYVNNYDEADETLDDAWKYGGAQNVLLNREPDIDGINECIEYVQTMWAKIAAESIVKDADITSLLVNTNFDSNAGWTGNLSVENGIGKIMGTGRGAQTLKELKNGVYELQMNGLFIPSGMGDSRFYTAYLYANDQIVPIMAADEDDAAALTVDEAAAAFAKGQYLNTILVNVTDGTLTLGVRNDGTVAGSDRLYVDNAKLTYRGELAEATESMSTALTCQSARAAALVASKGGDGSDYMAYPGFAQTIKDQLQSKIDAVATTSDPYALITDFTSLFTQVQQCQRSYISMYGFMSDFTDRYDSELYFYLNDDQRKEISNVLASIADGYADGSISEEDARTNKAVTSISCYSQLFGQEPALVNGIYQIANADNLLWYALAVNNDNPTTKGALTADIDMSEILTWPTIGNGCTFNGTFDGQNHVIKNARFVLYGDDLGMFGKMGAKAVVRDFTVEGTMTIKDGSSRIGVVGNYMDGTLTGVHSALAITCEGNSTQVGGIVGYSENSNGDACTTITSCSFSGSLDTGTSSSGCFGGIVGDAGYPAFANCGNYGTITTHSTSTTVGGIVGTTHQTSWHGFRYCINVGNIVCTDKGDNKCAAFVGEVGWYSGGSVYNNYYLDSSSDKASTGNQFPADLNKAYSATEFADGTVTNLLNMKQGTPAWYQGEAYPMLSNTTGGGQQEADTDGAPLITKSSQLSSNASDRDEGQHIEYLIDGDASTFWHTDWHSVCTDQYHYLQVALNEQFTGEITLKMTRRTSSSNDHPTKMIVWVSTDGADYTELTTLDLPYNGTGTEVSAKFSVTDANYLRFAASDCTGTDVGYRTFWHAGEFQLYGTNANAIQDITTESIAKGIYNLAGQKLLKLQKGINIVDGKKIFVK